MQLVCIENISPVLWLINILVDSTPVLLSSSWPLSTPSLLDRSQVGTGWAPIYPTSGSQEHFLGKAVKAQEMTPHVLSCDCAKGQSSAPISREDKAAGVCPGQL